MPVKAKLSSWITAVFGLVAGAALLGAADSNPLSTLGKVAIESSDAEVVVRLTGSKTPDFTSFTERDPFRVVVDWAGSKLGSVPADRDLGDGLIRRIACRQVESESEHLSRVTIELARETEFRFATEGKQVAVHFKKVAVPPVEPPIPELVAPKATLASHEKVPDGPLTEPVGVPAPPKKPSVAPVVLAKVEAPKPSPAAAKADVPKVETPPVMVAAKLEAPKAEPAPLVAAKVEAPKPAPAPAKVEKVEPAPLVVAKVEAPKPVVAKAEAPKVERPVIAAKVEEPKPVVAKVEPPKVEEPKPVVAKVEPPKVETPAIAPKVEAPKPVVAKAEPAKVEPPAIAPKVEAPKPVVAKAEPAKVESPVIAAKVEAPKPVVAKVEPPKVEPPAIAAKVEAPRPVVAKAEAPKVETPAIAAKVEAPKPVAAKVEAPKAETPAVAAKVEAPKPVVAKVEAPKPAVVVPSTAPAPTPPSTPVRLAGWKPTQEAPATYAANPGRPGEAQIVLAQAQVQGRETLPDPKKGPGTSAANDADPGPRVMTYVGFRNKATTSEVFVRCDGKARYKVEQAGDNRFVLELMDTRVNVKNNERPLDTSYFKSSVTRVQAVPSGSSTRIEVDLRERVPYEVKRMGSTISIEFKLPGAN